jgi:hypothetical protein
MGTYDVLDIVTMLPILFFPTPNNTFFILKSYPSFGRSNFIIWIQQHSLFEALLKRLTLAFLASRVGHCSSRAGVFSNEMNLLLTDGFVG